MKLSFYQAKTKITLKKSDYFIRFECFLSSFNSFLQTAGALTFFKLCLKHSVNPSSSIRRILFVSTSKPRPSASKLGIFFFTSEIARVPSDFSKFVFHPQCGSGKPGAVALSRGKFLLSF